MGKITEVLYETVDPNVCSPMEASKYYYYLNLVGSHEIFHKPYEAYEMNQMNIRNRVLGNAIRDRNLQKPPKVSTTIFGISSLRQRAVVIAEM